MKTVFMSVEEGFLESPPNVYMTSKRLTHSLSGLVDLRLVHPSDYCINDMSIRMVYRREGERLIPLGEHITPSGDLFIIYGDETSKARGVDFGRKQYALLKRLQDLRRFNHFLNPPHAEENTMKDMLVNLYAEGFTHIPFTAHFSGLWDLTESLKEYSQLVAKPIFGCRGTGIRIIKTEQEAEDLAKRIDDLFKEYVFQEVLDGPEKRIVILNRQLLCSRIHFERETPWRKSSSQRTEIYKPTQEEIEISIKLSERLGLTLAGIDFIGSKINEINGTGTGLALNDHNGNLLYDHTPNLVSFIMDLLK